MKRLLLVAMLLVFFGRRSTSSAVASSWVRPSNSGRRSKTSSTRTARSRSTRSASVLYRCRGRDFCRRWKKSRRYRHGEPDDHRNTACRGGFHGAALRRSQGGSRHRPIRARNRQSCCLSGQEIHVRRSSSYFEHLAALSAGFEKSGRPTVAEGHE